MLVNCDMCGSEVADMARICSGCSRPLVLDLEDVPGLDQELETTVCKLARMGSGGPSGSEPKMPANMSADLVGRRLKGVLVEWSAFIADTRGVPRPLDGLAPISTWLIGSVEWLRHHEAGADAVTQIRDAVRDVRRAIDRPRERVFGGYCDECGTALYGSESASQVACPTCVQPDGVRTSYGLSERREAMFRAMADMHMAPPEAAYALSTLVAPIKAQLIRTWAARDKLSPASVDDKGRNLYRLSDIADLMLKQAALKAS